LKVLDSAFELKGLGFFFVWHPFRVREVLDLVSGGIAALNHRLKASIPPGCKEIKGAPGKKKPSPFSRPRNSSFWYVKKDNHIILACLNNNASCIEECVTNNNE
jgi:hypothetical protein